MHNYLPIPSVIVIGLVAMLASLALLTQAGVLWIDSRFPPQGDIVTTAAGPIHIVDLGPKNGAELPVVMVHGASSNLKAMRLPLGDNLAKTRRVILIDRSGHGWSPRDPAQQWSLESQARAIAAVLDRIGIPRAVLVAHSFGGAVATRLALDEPQRVAGLVVLAGATHPWPGGGVGQLNKLLTTPLIGPLLAYTVTLPVGLFLVEPGARSVFLPQTMPDGYVDATATPLLLRPREMLANAWDLTALNAELGVQMARYPQIAAPTIVIHGDADEVASLDIHSRALAKEVPGARLIVLPGVGHMVQNAAPELVQREIEGLIPAFVTKSHATMR